MEKEKQIVKTIKNLTSKLNKQLVLAAENNIEARFEDIGVTQIGDQVQRTQMNVRLFKAL